MGNYTYSGLRVKTAAAMEEYKIGVEIDGRKCEIR